MSTFPFSAVIEPKRVEIMMICEAFPEDAREYFYSSTDSIFVVNTVKAFNDAGIKVKNINDILKKGVYLTVAVKTARKGFTVPVKTIEEHSSALEKEIEAFPNLKAILLMGDAAIKAVNLISRRATGKNAVRRGSTYKIRTEKFYFKNIRVFPSYLQTGKNFLIEKSKQRMVAEDIREAFQLLKKQE